MQPHHLPGSLQWSAGCYKSVSFGRWFCAMLRRRLGVLVTGLLLTPMIVLMLVHNPDLSSERRLVENVSELRELISAAQANNRLRLEDISVISAKLNSIIPGPNATAAAAATASQAMLNDSKKSLVSSAALTAQERSFLANYSIHQTLRLPSIYSYLPHLLNDPYSTTPAFLLSKGRSGVSMVLGVPTVQREVQSYLLATLTNLIECMSPQDKNNSLIIVFVGETDLSYVHKVASLVENNLAEYLNSGLIEIISPPASFYPDFSTLRQTLGDKPERVKWRTKQNLDYAFLMMYAQSRGIFYVQLEDDVQTKKNFLSTMKSFALQKTHENKDWIVLDFCQLGFIGKLFRTTDLFKFVTFLLVFNNDKPCDWLLDHYIQVKVCSYDKNAKLCRKAKENVWIRYKPSLFQHIGTHSSLKGKVQKLKDRTFKPDMSANQLKDKQFGKVQLFFPHDNPAAKVRTSIKPYKSYTFDKAYRGETYFWGLLPQQGDFIAIEFISPIIVSEFLFKSGNLEHPSDKLYNTTVEVLPTNPNITAYPKSDLEQFHVVGKFDDMGVAEGKLLPALGTITKMMLRVHSESDNWAILSEIKIVTGAAR